KPGGVSFLSSAGRRTASSLAILSVITTSAASPGVRPQAVAGILLLSWHWVLRAQQPAAVSVGHVQSLGRRAQSLPQAARRGPRRLVPLEPGGARPGSPDGAARVPLRRLLGLSLVPRDGKGVVQGPEGGEHPERGLRKHQDGPRGAAEMGRAHV